MREFEYEFSRFGKPGPKGLVDRLVESVFFEWAVLCDRFATEMDQYTFASNERSTVSILVSAASRLGFLAVGEMQLARGDDLGFGDMLLYDHILKRKYLFEAKQSKVSLCNINDDDVGKNVGTAIRAARGDAKAIKEKNVTKIAVSFFWINGGTTKNGSDDARIEKINDKIRVAINKIRSHDGNGKWHGYVAALWQKDIAGVEFESVNSAPTERYLPGVIAHISIV